MGCNYCHSISGRQAVSPNVTDVNVVSGCIKSTTQAEEIEQRQASRLAYRGDGGAWDCRSKQFALGTILECPA